jgi:hypothetical protein
LSRFVHTIMVPAATVTFWWVKFLMSTLTATVEGISGDGVGTWAGGGMGVGVVFGIDVGVAESVDVGEGVGNGVGVSVGAGVIAGVASMFASMLTDFTPSMLGVGKGISVSAVVGV